MVRFGQPSTVSSTKPTKQSRSRRTRATTAAPSILRPATSMPNPALPSIVCGARRGDQELVSGMQPTRAQVVP